MSTFSSGQRVKLARTGPFFASEKAGNAILEQVGIKRMKEMRTDFDTTLKEAQLKVGSAGTVEHTYVDGYAQVKFDTGYTLDIPLHLLETA